jgi:hypothetical protein
MNVSSLLPGFFSAANNLHIVLLSVCLVLAFAGLVYRCTTMYRERSLQLIWPYLVKMSVAFAALATMSTWGGWVMDMVSDVNAQAGLNQTGVLTTFANDVAKKFSLQVNASGQPASQAAPQQQTNLFQWVWKCRIQYSFLVLEFRFSQRGCCTGDRDALASAFQRFDRCADRDRGAVRHDLLRAGNARDVDHVAFAAGLSGSLLRGVAHFSGVHSSSADGSNGSAFFHELYFRSLLANWMGDRQFSHGRFA